ncbi:MFS transporter [Pseudoalteromonas sp. AOP31-A2-14]|uniref:MFS transporter n=1 Tax=Pseudoalteromonas sp. AOP31-A2-14 TaxID=3457695 RepID=UPI003FB9ED54
MSSASSISKMLLFLMTAAIAATAANLYYSQPLLPLIAREFNLTDAKAGSVVALTQFGYAAALLFISPLGDSVPRKRVIDTLSVLLVLSSLLAFAAPNLVVLLVGVFLIGLSANITQQLIPFAASMIKPEEKGATLGTLMMGLTVGILLSRTLSGSVAEYFGWRAVFVMSALLAAVFGLLLYKLLPHNTAHTNLNYKQLLKSTFVLYKKHKPLQIFTLAGASWFAAFNALWATLAIHVSHAPFNYNAQQAGLFGVIALAGVIGAKSSGKWVNKIGSKVLVKIALALIAIGFIITGLYVSSLVALIVGIILIDFGVFSAQVANQVRVFSIDPQAQSRINGVYMLGYYLGGTLGSIAGAKAYQYFAWLGVTSVSLTFILIALIFNKLAPKKQELS